MKNLLLLLEDLEPIGRKGEVVSVKPGFARNYLLPQKKAVISNRTTLKLQEKLKEEREKQALVDKAAAEEQAQKIAVMVITTHVKVDPEGKMYGSVNSTEVARLLKENGLELDRRNVILPQPIKSIGKHTITLRLKEGVAGAVTLEVLPEGGLQQVVEEKKTKKKKKAEAETTIEETEESPSA